MLISKLTFDFGHSPLKKGVNLPYGLTPVCLCVFLLDWLVVVADWLAVLLKVSNSRKLAFSR